MRERRPRLRVLAVDPSPRGLGFAVIEHPLRLIAWGTREIYGRNRNCQSAAAVERLCAEYVPRLLALENGDAPTSRRRTRVRSLLRILRRRAAKRRLRVRLITPDTLRGIATGDPKATKRAVAVALTRRFPILAAELPRVRKSWMSEHPRMAVFDAIATGCAALPHTPLAQVETRDGP